MAGFFWGFVVALLIVFGFDNDEPKVVVERVIPENSMVVTDIREEWCQGPADVPIVGRTVEISQISRN